MKPSKGCDLSLQSFQVGKWQDVPAADALSPRREVTGAPCPPEPLPEDILTQNYSHEFGPRPCAVLEATESAGVRGQCSEEAGGPCLQPALPLGGLGEARPYTVSPGASAGQRLQVVLQDAVGAGPVGILEQLVSGSGVPSHDLDSLECGFGQRKGGRQRTRHLWSPGCRGHHGTELGRPGHFLEVNATSGMWRRWIQCLGWWLMEP